MFARSSIAVATWLLGAATALAEEPSAPSSDADGAGGATAESKPAESAEKHLFFASGMVQFRQLAIVDDDPANDRMMRSVLTGGVNVFEGFRAFARGELRQHFYVDPGEQFELRDTQLGVDYRHEVDVGLNARKLELMYRASAFVPTSRASIDRDFVLAPEGFVDVAFEVVDRLTLGATGKARYHWHRTANRVGPGAPQNTQVYALTVARAEYALVHESRWGSLMIGVDAWYDWDIHYPAFDPYVDETGASFSRSVSHGLGWDAYVVYAPIKALSLGVSLERGGRVLRDGIVNPKFLGMRDDVELAFALSGRY